MSRLILAFLICSFNICLAQVRKDSVMIVNKVGPTIIKKDTLVSNNSASELKEIEYQHHAAISLDLANFLTSSVFVNFEVPINSKVSGILQYGNLLYNGINVTRNSTSDKKDYYRNQIYGLGLRFYTKLNKTKERSPWYIQPQLYTGNADIATGQLIPKYRTYQFISSAINVGHNGIKHRGLFLSYDAGIGVISVQSIKRMLYFRLGLEVGFAL